ncbi:MAG: cyclase family protein [Synergistaceae bacterium]|jgi:kynurenine formamidase|nr:cyclase family protein [Synergistaceae bacterium]
MKVIDLTQTLEDGMAVYPGAPLPKFERLGSVKGGDPYQLIKFEMTTHVGTHLDCQTHVSPRGYNADSQDLSFFMGKGIVIDCSKYGEGAVMGMEIFDGVDISDKEFIFLFCDWAKRWYDPSFWGNYPIVSKEVIEFLANSKQVKGLGVEYAAIDPLTDPGLTLHKLFLAKEKTIIENLTNLDQLIGQDFQFIGLPLKFKDGDGSPIRAAAILVKSEI